MPRIVSLGVRGRRDWAAQAPDEPRLELVLGGQPVHRDHAALRGGDEERAPRARHRGVDGERIGHLASLAHEGRVLYSREYDEPDPTTELTLPIEGMTCASCVNRIERFLRKTPGVQAATVNLATEMATIRYLPDLADRGVLVGAIESAGYDVRERPSTADATPFSLADEVSQDDLDREREARSLLDRRVSLDRGRHRDHGPDVRPHRVARA